MKIIFVYNANSGFFNSILDIGHKVLSPKTYECILCNLTYGLVNEKVEWKKYRESSKDEFEFLHKDEFEKKFKEKRDYPVILKINEANKLDELIRTYELNKMKNLNELIQKLRET